ncbi:MAG: PLP-dependent aminotransferase family protein [Candidatus Izimaplasma sp.]|nr:PLP-dependent aminotransferase family protein [Candidatus Izimaplasma bacterium]
MSEKRLYEQVYDAIKENILNDYYKAHTKLESIRNYAKKHNISTTTVEKAYNQLAVEGYIASRPRSGYYVTDITKIKKQFQSVTLTPIAYHPHPNDRITPCMFETKAYKKTVNHVLNYDTETLLSPCHPSGEPRLREQIQRFLREERNVLCDVNQIVVGAGIQSLLHILLGITQNNNVMYLTPEFTKAINIFRQYQYTLIEKASFLDLLNTPSDFLYISPSNMYPSGEILKVSDRNKLITWAHDYDAYIIEDDYNYLMRYNSQVIPAIQSFDESHVIYIGSFSKTLLPSLRMSYMVLPPKLYALYQKKYFNFAQGVSKLEQLSIAYFMESGLYYRHLKKLSKLYKDKNEILLHEIAHYQSDQFTIRSTDANLHLVFDFKQKKDCQTFIKNCHNLSYKYQKIIGTNSIIFPYSGIENTAIPKITKALLKNI